MNVKKINVFIDFPISKENKFQNLRMPQTLYNALKLEKDINLVGENDSIDIIMAFNGGSHCAAKNTTFFRKVRKKMSRFFPFLIYYPKIDYGRYEKENTYYQKRIEKLQKKNPSAKLIVRVDDRYQHVCKVYGYDKTVRWLLKKADACIHQNNYCHDLHNKPLDSIFGVLPKAECKRNIIIENPVDTTLFCPDGPKKDLPGKIKILHVSASTMARKGVGVLLEVAHLLRHNKDIQFILVGRQEQDPIYGNDIKKFDNVHKFPFTDNSEELAAYYRSCDMMLFPSIKDCSPNTVLESMSCGTPVVGFDSGGFKELVVKKDIRGGLFLIEENPVYAVKEMLANLEEFSKNSRKIAEDYHSKEFIGKQYVELFKELLSN